MEGSFPLAIVFRVCGVAVRSIYSPNKRNMSFA